MKQLDETQARLNEINATMDRLRAIIDKLTPARRSKTTENDDDDDDDTKTSDIDCDDNDELEDRLEIAMIEFESAMGEKLMEQQQIDATNAEIRAIDNDLKILQQQNKK